MSNLHPRLPVGWVSLDVSDNDPVQFWTYVIAALKEVQPEICETAWSLLHSPQPPPIELLLTSLINEIIIASEIHSEGAILDKAQGKVKGCSYILVLDDYHVIEAQAIHAGLTFLLDHLPPNLHLVIATRADPPLLLARLRARDELLELRAADM